MQIIAQGFGMSLTARDARIEAQSRRCCGCWRSASIPVGVVGLLFNKQAETTWRNPFVIGVMLIAVGLVMWIAEHAGSQGQRASATITMADALVDRAGAGAGRRAGHLAQRHHHHRRTVSQSRPARRRRAFRFCFPRRPSPRRAAKALHDLHEAGRHSARTCSWPFVVGVAVSALVGCAVIAWFLHYLQRHTLTVLRVLSD